MIDISQYRQYMESFAGLHRVLSRAIDYSHIHMTERILSLPDELLLGIS